MPDLAIEEVLKSAILPVIVGIIVWFIQSRIEAIRRERERLNEQRRAIYLGILEPFLRLFVGLKDSSEVAKATEVIKSFEYRKIAAELNMIADDKVIASFNNMMQAFYQSTGDQPVTPTNFLSLYGQFMLEIRKSVGNSKTELEVREMLAGWITDIDKFYAPKKPPVKLFSPFRKLCNWIRVRL